MSADLQTLPLIHQTVVKVYDGDPKTIRPLAVSAKLPAPRAQKLALHMLSLGYTVEVVEDAPNGPFTRTLTRAAGSMNYSYPNHKAT